MKKIIGFFILILLIGTTFSVVGLEDEKIEEIIMETTYDENNINQNLKKTNGLLQSPLIDINIEPVLEYSSNSQNMEYLPNYFNWRDHEGQDWTTPVKNQGMCGSCGIFAALGVLESVINIREGKPDLNPDLSEQYVMSCLPRAGGCSGSQVDWVYKYILNNDSDGNNNNGIIPETCFHYFADDTIPCSDKYENWLDYIIPISKYGSVQGFNNTKRRIMNRGPVVDYIEVNDNFTFWGLSNHDEEDYFPYEYREELNHAIMIVGWKDDPNIEHGGYWICKNSWGDKFGYNGFFNIEYESLGIGIYQSNWVDYDPNDVDWFPLPKSNGPYYGLINKSLTFHGDVTGDFPPFNYHWDFGDGSTSTEQNPTYMYLESGEYLVKFTVTDNRGISSFDETTAWIQETNQAPSIVSLEGPSEIKVGEHCYYNVTMSDPDQNPLYIYPVVFGFDSNVWLGPATPDQYDIYYHYFWKEEGDYLVKFKVMDPYGAESDWAVLEVTVAKSKSLNVFNPWISRLIERSPILELLI
jgi:hypothetical protein